MAPLGFTQLPHDSLGHTGEEDRVGWEVPEEVAPGELRISRKELRFLQDLDACTVQMDLCPIKTR